MRLGITGVNGFVGNALVRAAVARGWDVVGTLRPAAHGDAAYGTSLRIVEDPWSPTEWERALGDLDVVVHLVGRAHHVGEDSDEYDAYYRDNVLVSEAVLAGLTATSVRKVVFLSSIKAIGEQTVGVPIDEHTVPAPTTAYGMTKLSAEERFADWAASESRDLVVLRPPLVYGPGVKGNFNSLLHIASSPIPLPIGSIGNRRSMIYIDNLCDAILASASGEIRGIHRLPVADAEVLSTPDVVAVLRAAMGRSVRMFRFPERVLAAASRAAGVEGQFGRISDDLVVDSHAAEIELGWRPRRTVIEGLVETARWYTASIE